MPSSSEAGRRGVSATNEGGNDEGVSMFDAEVSGKSRLKKQNRVLLEYPTDVEVDENAKTVNITWFAQQYMLANKSLSNTENCHQLATYVLAKAFPTLPKNKWRMMFSEKDLSTDEHLKGFLNTARDFYLMNHNLIKRNWKNTVLGYLRKMLYLPAYVGISQLYFLQLAGHLPTGMNPDEIREIMGGARNFLKMNSTFSETPEAKFKLVLPDNLKADFQGQGFTLQELQWVGDVDAFIQVSGPGAPLEEDVDMKSSVFWGKEIERLRNKITSVGTKIEVERKQLSDSEKEMCKAKADLHSAIKMQQVALKREDLVDSKKTPDQKLAAYNTFEKTKELFCDDLTEEAAVNSFKALRRRVQAQKLQEEGSSGKRARNLSPGGSQDGNKSKHARNAENDGPTSTSDGPSRKKQPEVEISDDDDDDESQEADETSTVAGDDEDDKNEEGEDDGKDKMIEENDYVDETCEENEENGGYGLEKSNFEEVAQEGAVVLTGVKDNNTNFETTNIENDPKMDLGGNQSGEASDGEVIVDSHQDE